jgi:acyl carrier protein
MRKNEILRNLENLMELNNGSLIGDEKLYNLAAWDSLAVLGFIAFTNKQYDITLSANDINKAETINDLVNLIESKLCK